MGSDTSGVSSTVLSAVISLYILGAAEENTEALIGNTRKLGLISDTALIEDVWKRGSITPSIPIKERDGGGGCNQLIHRRKITSR